MGRGAMEDLYGQAQFWDWNPFGADFGDWRMVLGLKMAGFVGVGLAVGGLLRAARTALPKWRGSLAQMVAEARAPLGPVLKEKVLEMKAKQLRTLLQAGCYVLLPVTFLVSVSGRPFFENGEAALVLAQIALALPMLWPRLVTARSLDAVFLAASALVALALSPFMVSEQLLVPWLLLGNCLMMMLVLVRRAGYTRLPVLGLASLLHGASSCSTIMVRGMMRSKMALLALQAGATALAPLVAQVLERWSQAWMYKMLEVEELQGLLSASQCLLRSCFDVVLELDEEGRILTAGPELGALLLRGTPSMQGEAFCALLEIDDALEFRQRMSSPAAAEVGLAENMRVTVRDACGNRLGLELMWFSFTRMEKRQRHVMLGLREASDAAAPPPPRRKALSMAASEASESPDEASSASDDSSLPEDRSVSSGPGLVTLVVDEAAPGLPVLRCSAAFQQSVGRVAQGKPLASLVKRPRDFKAWVRGGGQGIRHVVLKMPHGKVTTLCKVQEEAEGPGTTLLFQVERLEHLAEDPAPARNVKRRGTGSSVKEEGKLCCMEL